MLLIKDLSARLPYAVTVEHTSGFSGILHDITVYHMYDDNDNVYDAVCYTDFFGDNDDIYIEYFKPYLFPMSSMTEEQHTDMFNYYHNAEIEEVYASSDYLKAAYIGDDKKYEWLNRNHFDYRGLIEKGLALDATGLNIY